MKQEISTKATKHVSIGLRLPQNLYEQLVLKSQEMGGIGISETIRDLLNSSLENHQFDKHFKYTLMIYSLLEEALLSLVENGENLIKRADAKAEKILASIAEQ